MVDRQLAKRLEQLKEKLKEPISAPQPEESEMAKKAKKVVKKVTAKKEKNDNVVRLADLAKEAKVSPQRARQKLRAAEGIERDGRWKWEKDSSELKKVRKALDLAA